MTQETPTSGFEATEKILLYYPTIDIPSPSWIRQGLMYWDKIGSIVPDSYDERLPSNLRYSDQIQPLYDAKLFHPFNPADLFSKGWQTQADEAFKKELLETLDSDEFTQKLPQQRIFREQLYPEKVNLSLANELEGRNLIAKHQDGGFYHFEKNTARVYMAILAKHLADLSDQLTIPSTDLSEYEQLNFAASPTDTMNPCLRVEFRNLLRVPADDVEIKRVIDFRLEHNDKLLNFRQQVLDKFEDEIKKCTEVREIKDKTIRFRSQIERGVRELNQVLSEGKFQTVAGTLKSIFKPQHITSVLSTATATGAATGSLGIATFAGLITGAFIEISEYFVSRDNLRWDKLRTNAYSYLYQAEKEFGTKT